MGFLEPRLSRARALLADHGTLYFHIDYREAHYCKLLLDEIFGRDAFLNEIIWAYDYGAKPRRRWPAKHDTILVYVRTPAAHFFDADAVEREPYMAPGLVSAEKAARGKRPTDVWFHTIVPTNGREKTGYPTQKPEGVIRRMVAASSRPGGVVPGSVRRLGDARRGVPGVGAAVRARRLESGGDRGDAGSAGPRLGPAQRWSIRRHRGRAGRTGPPRVAGGLGDRRFAASAADAAPWSRPGGRAGLRR